MFRTRLMLFALIAFASSAVAARQQPASTDAKQAPPQAAEPDDEPSLSTDDLGGVSSRRGNRPLPANLTLGQLYGLTSQHYYDIYTLGGLRVTDVYLGAKGMTPQPFVIDVVETATNARTAGLTPGRFVFETNDEKFANELKTQVAKHARDEARLVFRFSDIVTAHGGTTHGGEVSEVQWLDRDGSVLERVTDEDFH